MRLHEAAGLTIDPAQKSSGREAKRIEEETEYDGADEVTKRKEAGYREAATSDDVATTRLKGQSATPWQCHWSYYLGAPHACGGRSLPVVFIALFPRNN